MSKLVDIIGTSLTSFQIGTKQTGAKVLRFINGSNIGNLSWTPTANRTLTLPDKTDTLAGLSDIGFSVFTVSGTARTINSGDAQKTLYCTNSAPLVITIPTHASVPLTVGTVIEIIQTTSNSVTVTPSSGVTLSRYNGTDGSQTLLGQWCVAQLKKVSADSWVFFFKSTQSASQTYSYILDAVPGAVVGCSTIQLKSTATIAATIQRSSDSATAGIGFTSGLMSTSAITTFGGVGDTFLTSFADQTGNNLPLVATSDQRLKASAGSTTYSWGNVPCFNTQPGSRLDSSTMSLTPSGYTVFTAYKRFVGDTNELPLICGSGLQPIGAQNMYGTNIIAGVDSSNLSFAFAYEMNDNGYFSTIRYKSGESTHHMASNDTTAFNSQTFSYTLTNFSTLNYYNAGYTNIGQCSLIAYLVYPRIITPIESLTLEGFFANKIGSTGLTALPSYHPYKSAPPF